MILIIIGECNRRSLHVAYYIVKGSSTVSVWRDENGRIQVQKSGDLQFKGSFFFKKHPDNFRHPKRWLRAAPSGLNILESSNEFMAPIILTKLDDDWTRPWSEVSTADDGFLQDTYVSPTLSGFMSTTRRPSVVDVLMFETYFILRRDQELYEAYLHYDKVFDGETFDAIMVSADDADAL